MSTGLIEVPQYLQINTFHSSGISTIELHLGQLYALITIPPLERTSFSGQYAQEPEMRHLLYCEPKLSLLNAENLLLLLGERRRAS